MSKPSIVIYRSGTYNPVSIEALICKDQGLSVEEHFVDPTVIMRISAGQVGPNGYVIEVPTGELLFNYFDLCKWIDQQGLRQI